MDRNGSPSMCIAFVQGVGSQLQDALPSRIHKIVGVPVAATLILDLEVCGLED